MSNNRGNIIQNIDWFIVGTYLILVFFGVMSIYAADYDAVFSDFLDFNRRAGKQFIWGLISLVVGVLILKIESKIIQSLAYPLFITTLIVQVFVILFAKEVNGAKAWLELGPIKIQPAEFAKFATALALSVYVGKLSFGENKKRQSIIDYGKDIGRALRGKKVFSISNLDREKQVYPIAIILIPIILIVLQKDTGTALVFFALTFPLFREGIIGNIMYNALAVIFITIITLMFNGAVSFVFISVVAFVLFATLLKKSQFTFASYILLLLYFVAKNIWDWAIYLDLYLAVAWILISGLITLVYKDAWKRTEKISLLGFLIVTGGFIYSIDTLYSSILKPYQRARIDIVLGKLEDPDIGFQTEQSMNAIGSGGLLGKGYLQGTLTQGRWVPEQSTDYIFCTVGEEWGFLGSVLVIGLMITLILRIVYKAEKQRNKTSRIYGYCVASILFFHFLVNIGITIQLMPVIGIPLPFFSYGGSSLLSFTILLFIFLRFDSQKLDLL